MKLIRTRLLNKSVGLPPSCLLQQKMTTQSSTSSVNNSHRRSVTGRVETSHRLRWTVVAIQQGRGERTGWGVGGGLREETQRERRRVFVFG